MTYLFCGQLSGQIAPGFSEPLAGATLRLYKYRGTKYVSGLSVADPGATLTMLSPDARQAKKASFITETTADGEGRFIFTLDEQSDYDGGPCELDLLLTNAPHQVDQAPKRPVQIPLTTLRLKVQNRDETLVAWEYCLPAAFWREVRAAFDAWVICGRVLAQDAAQPMCNVRITAFDADWLQDDRLGSAVTDAAGKFRIDYTRADFTRTPLSPLFNRENGGPDLYFKLETPEGAPLLIEPKSQGFAAGRANANHCFFIEFNVEQAPVMSPERVYQQEKSADLLGLGANRRLHGLKEEQSP